MKTCPGCSGWRRHIHAYAASETTYGQPDGIYGITAITADECVYTSASRVQGTNMSIAQAENERVTISLTTKTDEREVRYCIARPCHAQGCGADEQSLQDASAKVRRKQAAVRTCEDNQNVLCGITAAKPFTIDLKRFGIILGAFVYPTRGKWREINRLPTLNEGLLMENNVNTNTQPRERRRWRCRQSAGKHGGKCSPVPQYGYFGSNAD